MKNILKIVLSVVGLASLGGAVYGATDSSILMKIPFDFVAGGKLLPAGDYRFMEASASGLVMIEGRGNGNSVTLITSPDNPLAAGAEMGARFERRDGQTYLVEVTLESRLGRMVRIRPVR